MPAPRATRSVSRIREFVTALQAALSEAFPHLGLHVELAVLGSGSVELTLSWTDTGGRVSSVSRPVDLFAPVDAGIDALVQAVYARTEIRAAA
ncbi:MAG TPA: hypothetical protein VGR37_19325 [Longimicrobiaceae bacterium]|nr:hypothetical protein [Longimicrobiaceae bacterium]